MIAKPESHSFSSHKVGRPEHNLKSIEAQVMTAMYRKSWKEHFGCFCIATAALLSKLLKILFG